MVGQTVLVTGGSGYVATWVIATLLKRGYQVRATLRRIDLQDDVRAAVAKRMEPGDQLTFHVADLRSDSGWVTAMQGAQAVFHVAAPTGEHEGRGAELIQTARRGTVRVVQAAQRAGVPRVVFTSSLQAALPLRATQPIDETTWTDLSMPGLSAYAQSKTQAERDAWQCMQQSASPTTLTTLLPGLILGPVLGEHCASSLGMVARLLGGHVMRLPRIGFSIVDVRDLADLYVRAMENPQAAGQRYVASSNFLWLKDIARILHEHLGARARRVPTRTMPNMVIRLGALFSADVRDVAFSLGQRREFSAAKATQELGWHARPAAQSIVDCAESLLQAGLVH